MLREEGGRVRESPLPAGGERLTCMLTIVGRSIQRSKDVSYHQSAIGLFSVGAAYVASRISPAIARRSSLAAMQGGVYSAVSSCKGEIKKAPSGIVEVTFGGLGCRQRM